MHVLIYIEFIFIWSISVDIFCLFAKVQRKEIGEEESHGYPVKKCCLVTDQIHTQESKMEYINVYYIFSSFCF